MHAPDSNPNAIPMTQGLRQKHRGKMHAKHDAKPYPVEVAPNSNSGPILSNMTMDKICYVKGC